MTQFGYFGPPDRRCFAAIDSPSAPHRATVVVLPPIGYEQVAGHLAIRRLTRRLAAGGIRSVRIDYHGTGNSMGDMHDPDRFEAWTASAVDAIERATAADGEPPIVVALRLGCLVAEQAARVADIAGMVLWDPILDGRRHVRTLKLLGQGLGPIPLPHPDDVAAGGIVYPGALLRRLATLRLSTDRLHVPALIVSRVESPELVTAAGTSVVRIAGMADLFDVDAEIATVPEQAVQEIATWIGGAAPTVTHPGPLDLDEEASESVDGATLIHRARTVGSADVFAIDTRVHATMPCVAVLALNNGVAPSIGPGRSWLEFGRALAVTGFRVVRCDLSGLGNTPARPGCTENQTFPYHAGEDIAQVVATLAAEGVTEVVPMGLCSGALTSFDGALRCPQIRTIVSINGRPDHPFTDPRSVRRHRAGGQTNRLLAIPLRKTPLIPTFNRIPEFIWSVLDAVRLVARPTVAYERFERLGGRVLAVFGDEELGLLGLRHRAGRRLAGLVERGAVDLRIVDDLDHSMFRVHHRPEVLDIVQGYLRDRFAAALRNTTA